MKSFLKWLLGIMFLLSLLTGFIWLINEGVDEINDRGLKNILVQVWEGETIDSE